MPPKNDKSADKVAKLVALLREKRSLLIVMQDNPDPDAIAAAAALRRIANARSDTACSIAYGGVIGRGENRTVAGYLGLNFRPIDEVDPAKYDAAALVDTQPAAGNNSLPADRNPDIVIDHHPLRPETRGVPFYDVRRRYGATSTILYEYLRVLDLQPEPPLATALLYAIRTDTQDLGLEASSADVAATESLYPLANTRMLSAIQRGNVGPAYYATMARALGNARIHGDRILVNLGDVDNPDMLGEMADLFLRHEGIEWVLCHGVHGGKLLLSLRTSQNRKGAGEVARGIIDGLGTGGGHATSAGGQVPLDKNTRAERDGLVRKIRERFLSLTGTTNGRGRRVIGPAERAPS